MICTYYLSDGVSMVTETSGTRTGTLDSEYENIGIIPIYFVLHWLLGLIHRLLDTNNIKCYLYAKNIKQYNSTTW